MNKRLFLLVALAVALSFCGCTKSTPEATAQANSPVAAAAKPAKAVCSYLSQADIEAVMGKGATTEANLPETECILKGQGVNVVTVTVMTYGGEWSNVKKGFKATDPSSKDIAGLGEDAFTFMGGTVAQKGQQYVSAGGALSEGAMSLEQGSKFLVEKVIAQL